MRDIFIIIGIIIISIIFGALISLLFFHLDPAFL